MLLIRFRNRRLPRKSSQRLFFLYFAFIILYCFYTPAYSSCVGLCSCSVGTSTAVAFGNYDPTLAAATTATGTVAISCFAISGIATVSYVISLNAGNSGSFTTRFMNLSGNHLNYNLYTTVALTTIWGDGTGGTSTVSDSRGITVAPSTVNYTVYGQSSAMQAVPAGTYTDSITITVTW